VIRSTDRLYALVPEIHRYRDAQRGYPLRALMRVLNEQANVVEDDIERLYRNWFIETCDDWVVPYIGALIGYTPTAEAGRAGDPRDGAGNGRNAAITPRREVANTLAARRRRGTLALLEQLARDVAGWPVHAVEFYARLMVAQHLNHLRPGRGRFVDLRNERALTRLDGPFDRAAHTVDVRRVASHRTPGRFNIPEIGLFVWRLRSYSISCAPACCIEERDARCFTFNALGSDTPLFVNAPQEDAQAPCTTAISAGCAPQGAARDTRFTPAERPGELRVPVRLSRSLLAERPDGLYGLGRSFTIFAPDWPAQGATQPVPVSNLVAADLSDWAYRARRDQVAIDPERGRLLFPANQLPKRGVWVRYHYGFSADIGGGEYPRSLSRPDQCTVYFVSKFRGPRNAADSAANAMKACRQDAPLPDAMDSINRALDKWRADQQALGAEPDAGQSQAHAQWQQARQKLQSAVIEIHDSAVYTEPLTVELNAGENLQICAASGWRPVLHLLDFRTEQPDSITVSGRKGSRFTIDGLLITGRGLRVTGQEDSRDDDLCDVRIRHSTLVPGWGIDCDCNPRRANEASLELENTSARIVIERSIVGSIEVTANERVTEPVQVSIEDSIVDATSHERVAIGSSDRTVAFAELDIRRCTVIGQVQAHAVRLAENSIFTSVVNVARRQIGCVRFCHVPIESRTPRRYHCQPELSGEPARVYPRFESERYGNPVYCRLARDVAPEIKRGADDESEMGVFHDLFEPMRMANLQARVDENVPAGMEAGVIFAD